MELVAVGIGLCLAGTAGSGEALRLSPMVVSLNAGMIAAEPVAALPIALGVEAGMHNSRVHAEKAGWKDSGQGSGAAGLVGRIRLRWALDDCAPVDHQN